MLDFQAKKLNFMPAKISIYTVKFIVRINSSEINVYPLVLMSNVLRLRYLCQSTVYLHILCYSLPQHASRMLSACRTSVVSDMKDQWSWASDNYWLDLIMVSLFLFLSLSLSLSLNRRYMAETLLMWRKILNIQSINISLKHMSENIFTPFLCPRDRRSGGILFLSCLPFCHSVLLSETLTLLITFEHWVLELWYFTWIFNETRPSVGNQQFFTLWPWLWSLSFFLKILTLRRTFDLWVLEFNHFTWIFVVAKCFPRNQHILPCDLDSGVWPFLKKH